MNFESFIGDLLTILKKKKFVSFFLSALLSTTQSQSLFSKIWDVLKTAELKYVTDNILMLFCDTKCGSLATFKDIVKNYSFYQFQALLKDFCEGKYVGSEKEAAYLYFFKDFTLKAEKNATKYLRDHKISHSSLSIFDIDAKLRFLYSVAPKCADQSQETIHLFEFFKTLKHFSHLMEYCYILQVQITQSDMFSKEEKKKNNKFRDNLTKFIVNYGSENSKYTVSQLLAVTGIFSLRSGVVDIFMLPKRITFEHYLSPECRAQVVNGYAEDVVLDVVISEKKFSGKELLAFLKSSSQPQTILTPEATQEVSQRQQQLIENPNNDERSPLGINQTLENDRHIQNTSQELVFDVNTN